MLNGLKKIYYTLKMGGVVYLFYIIEDKFKDTDKAIQYRYKLFKGANNTDRFIKLIELSYSASAGTKFDINNPKTFNEKIQWLKAFDSTPLKTQLADKYLVRDWLKEQIGEEYLVPLLGVWDKFDDIDFDSLPDKFALKCNHSSGMNLIVTDKSKIDMKKAKEDFDRWIATNFAFVNGELHYRDIPPKIIAEEYLDMSDGIKDYRFFCFNGTPKQVWVDKYSGTPNHKRAIYDMDWNKIDMTCRWPDGGEELAEKPKTFELMKDISIRLSKEFVFVRVDFFEVDGKLYMGELTFTPMNGTQRFNPPEWNLKLGEMMELPYCSDK